jgi:hypothetical protein
MNPCCFWSWWLAILVNDGRWPLRQIETMGSTDHHAFGSAETFANLIARQLFRAGQIPQLG